MFKLIVLLGLVSLCIAAPSGRVVNGTDARIEDYPWMASLHIWAGHNCGGSIISDRWILSAAHCDASTIEVGTDRWNAGKKIAVKRWIKHENYNPSTLENDIAVVELAEPIEFAYNMQPVKLPEPYYEVPGSYETRAYLTGFGFEQSGGNVQSRLKEAELFVVSNEECSQIHYSTVYQSMLCAGIREGGRGQCSGDSGGPLVVNGVQVGVVSWSVKPCAIGPYPGVYTKVSHFVPWIKAKTGMA
ncbi:trypsin-like [Culicoides brevitarsis]|uniref:trypsin-like n=1 Tax=Culicoides brevitarsis TaxID=469753 RepID=UPI00307CB6E5